MTQIIRYVRISDETCTIKESFLDFIESHQKTGKGLATEISEKLEKYGLSIFDCRGQGYDNGAKMSGKYNGVKAHILSLNESARFVPCAAHTLNLVGVHAAEFSPLMITFFEKVQAIWNFFSSFTSRWEKLMKTLIISLKGNSDTRWSTKKEAITPLHSQIKDVLQVLESIIHNPMTNAVTVSNATEKANQSGIDGGFPIRRKHKVKRIALYEAEDDSHLLTAETDFGSHCNFVFDSIITQIEWRFEADVCYSSDFQSEIASFKYQAAAMMDNIEKSSPIDILQLIHKYSLTDAYPNTTTAIRIFLTIPVTVATCERSFSKLKLIKHYMRSTIGQERLSSLAIISIENEVANNIDFDDVISEFASRKARKVALN
ncbi:zinc finger MYM-type protein 1-like [Hydra vulgaris]|uniref:Zinc finger MYM-type protein 1-like n=1 Tax=Hydra vulgaris TaxID=6087 RepID=A0ABM4DLW7_HYDVU